MYLVARLDERSVSTHDDSLARAGSARRDRRVHADECDIDVVRTAEIFDNAARVSRDAIRIDEQCDPDPRQRAL